MEKTRTEKDLLGTLEVPAENLYGIHTLRAMENFSLAHRPVHPALIHAYGSVKLACYKAIRRLPFTQDAPEKLDALEHAAIELAEGLLDGSVVVDALQGGAGTSLNMNVNEVIANRALQILGKLPGDSAAISPSDDANRYQSTNDTYPTALKLAAILRLRNLEKRVLALQEAFQDREKAFADVVKIGRTECQDAVLTTLGREMGAYAEALSRDRWRIYKCEERLRVVNLGGTAIGTGLAAPRQFIFEAVEILHEMTGTGLSRAENLVEATQNTDALVEVSGILKTLASSLIKICNDLRFLSSGPGAGIAEIHLPARQAGSSIMPGKINPVIPEAVIQAAMAAIGHDATLTLACSQGHLELNPFLPVIADCLLTQIDLLANACDILARLCVAGIAADREQCRKSVETSSSIATALLPALGYETVTRLVRKAAESNHSLLETVLTEQLLTRQQFDELISPEAVSRLGSPDNFFRAGRP